MLLSGSTLQEIKTDTLCLFYLDPRLIYIKGIHLIRDLTSYIEGAAPVTLEEHTAAQAKINEKLTDIANYKKNFVSLLLSDADVKSRLDDLYEPSFILNRYSFLLTGRVATEAAVDRASTVETPYGPFTKSQLSNSYIGNRYIGVNTSNEVVRASEVAELMGGSVRKYTIAEVSGETIISTSEGSLTVGASNYSYPLVLNFRYKTRASQEVALASYQNISMPPAPVTISIYREKAIATPSSEVIGPLFSRKSDSFSLKEGAVFKGDAILNKATSEATRVISSLGAKVRVASPILISSVVCVNSTHTFWKELLSSLNSIVLPTKGFSAAYSAQTKKLKSALYAFPLLGYQEANLSEKLLDIKTAHDRIDASTALFYLDSCRINEYNSLTSQSILNIESTSLNEIRKFGV